MKVSNVSFKANELKKVIDISRHCGLSDRGVKTLLNEVKKVCPNKEDKAFFYFRKYISSAFSYKPDLIRSGVKVVKDGKSMELSIDPRKFQPRDLLQEMVQGVKKLVNGVAKSEDKPVFYNAEKPKSWITYYSDWEKSPSNWFKKYQDSFKK